MRSSSAAACSASKRHDLGLGERLQRDAREWRAAPFRERRTETIRRAFCHSRRERTPTLVAQPLEAIEVQLPGSTCNR